VFYTGSISFSLLSQITKVRIKLGDARYPITDSVLHKAPLWLEVFECFGVDCFENETANVHPFSMTQTHEKVKKVLKVSFQILIEQHRNDRCGCIPFAVHQPSIILLCRQSLSTASNRFIEEWLQGKAQSMFANPSFIVAAIFTSETRLLFRSNKNDGASGRGGHSLLVVSQKLHGPSP